MKILVDRSKKLRLKLQGFEGHLDGLLGNDLTGWCYERRDRGRALKVGLVHNGQVVTTASADHFRAYLTHYGVRGGRTAFLLRVPEGLLEKARAGKVDICILDRVSGSRPVARLPGTSREMVGNAGSFDSQSSSLTQDDMLPYLEERISMSHEELARELVELRLMFLQNDRILKELRAKVDKL